MSENSFKAGFERGNEGKSSSSGMFDWIDNILESEKDEQDREEGFKAGVLAAAIRGDDDE